MSDFTHWIHFTASTVSTLLHSISFLWIWVFGSLTAQHTTVWQHYGKTPQGFTGSSWRLKPCRASASDRERVTGQTFPTWHTVTQCAVHPVIFSPLRKETEREKCATYRGENWKPPWLPVLPVSSRTLTSQEDECDQSVTVRKWGQIQVCNLEKWGYNLFSGYVHTDFN